MKLKKDNIIVAIKTTISKINPDITGDEGFISVFLYNPYNYYPNQNLSNISLQFLKYYSKVDINNFQSQFQYISSKLTLIKNTVERQAKVQLLIELLDMLVTEDYLKMVR